MAKTAITRDVLKRGKPGKKGKPGKPDKPGKPGKKGKRDKRNKEDKKKMVGGRALPKIKSHPTYPGKDGRKGNKKGNRRSKQKSVPRQQPLLPRGRPTAVTGRIYYGGGGGRTATALQVGHGVVNQRIRTSCNPLFHSSPGTFVRSTSAVPSNYGVRQCRNMKGGAAGAIFSTIIRTLVPVFKGLFKIGTSVAKSPVGQIIKQEAIRSGVATGIGVVGDALRGRNLEQSAKTRIKEQTRKLPDNIDRAISQPSRAMYTSQPTVSAREEVTTAKKKKKKPQTVVNRPPNSASSSSRTSINQGTTPLKRKLAKVGWRRGRGKDLFSRSSD